MYKSLSPKENVRNNKQQQANKCSRSPIFCPVVRTQPLELRNSKIPQIGPNYRGEKFYYFHYSVIRHLISILFGGGVTFSVFS